jgi:hypothetical protein
LLWKLYLWSHLFCCKNYISDHTYFAVKTIPLSHIFCCENYISIIHILLWKLYLYYTYLAVKTVSYHTYFAVKTVSYYTYFAVKTISLSHIFCCKNCISSYIFCCENYISTVIYHYLGHYYHLGQIKFLYQFRLISPQLLSHCHLWVLLAGPLWGSFGRCGFWLGLDSYTSFGGILGLCLLFFGLFERGSLNSFLGFWEIEV